MRSFRFKKKIKGRKTLIDTVTRLTRFLKGERENVGNPAPHRARSFYLPPSYAPGVRMPLYTSLFFFLSLSFHIDVSLNRSPSFLFESLTLGRENARCNHRLPLTTNKKIISRSTEPTFFSMLHPCATWATHILFKADLFYCQNNWIINFLYAKLSSTIHKM